MEIEGRASHRRSPAASRRRMERPASHGRRAPKSAEASASSPGRRARAADWEDSLEAFKQMALSAAPAAAPVVPPPRGVPSRVAAPSRVPAPLMRRTCDPVAEDGRSAPSRAAPPAAAPRGASGGDLKPRRDDFDDTPAEGVFAREPGGRQLTLTIFTTWGDPHYVGLSAVELYDMQGELIALADVKAQVRAEPADVNVLPGYGSDPRVVANLFDGALATCDDHHLWLAPFTAGARHTVSVDLRSLHRLSLVRIWNYNKSRIHSFRGARHVEIALDGAPIFRGEINKAPGNAYEAESCAEPILFTDVRRAIRRDSPRAIRRKFL